MVNVQFFAIITDCKTVGVFLEIGLVLLKTSVRAPDLLSDCSRVQKYGCFAVYYNKLAIS